MQTLEQMNAPLFAAASHGQTVTGAMRAIVHPQYGTPDVLALEEVERPVPGETRCWFACTRRARASATTTSSRASPT